MIKFFDRFAKRRVRQQAKATNQRKFQRGLRSGLETLEQRQLLAADLVLPLGGAGNFLPLGSPGGFTQSVSADLSGANKIPHGPNGALALTANWTDGNSVEVIVKIDQNGDGVFTGNEVDSFKLSDLTTALVSGTATEIDATKFPGSLGMTFPVLVDGSLAPAVHDAEGAIYQAGSGQGGVTSMVLVVPLGSSTIDRKAMIEVKGGTSTEILAGVGVYHNIDQANPLGGFAGRAHTAGSSTELGPVSFNAGDVALDAVMGRFGDNAANTLAPNKGNQQRLNQAVVITNNPPATPGRYVGAGSTNSIGESGWVYGQNPPFVLSHILAEVNGVAGVVLAYDFGDAPDTNGGTGTGNYQTLLANNGPHHAVTNGTGAVIVGPYFGPTAPDAELNGQPNAGATGDGADEGAPIYGNGTVSVGGVATPAGPSANGKFVSQSMATSTGYLTLEIEGVSVAKPGYVSAFIDWNRDGDFSDAGETILSGATAITTPGTLSFPVTIPKSADISAGNSILRIRIHSDPCQTGHALAALGHADDGEIEDHQIVLVKGSEIHGIKYEDVDGSGTVTAGDVAGMQGTNGVVIAISGGSVNDLFGNPLTTTLTNPSDGKFWFNYLVGGTYTVTEDLATTDINNDVGTLGAAGYDNLQGLVQSAALLNTSINVTTQGTVSNAPIFLNYIQGSIHGQKFEDINGDGVKASSDPVIGLVTFKLFRHSKPTPSTNHWTLVQTDLTDNAGLTKGRYDFESLAPGTYAVYEEPVAPIAGWLISTGQKSALPNAQAPSDLNSFVVTSRKEFVYNLADVVSGPLKVEELQTSLIFGNFLPGVINGQKYEDLNGNGKFDLALMFDKDGNGSLETTGETAFANITFELLDSTGAPVMVPGNILVPAKPASPMVPYTDKTDSMGKFEFVGLKPGVYMIREVQDTQDTNGDTVNDYFTSTTVPGQGLTKDPMKVTFTVKSQTNANLSAGTTSGANDTLANFSVSYDYDGNGTAEATGLPTTDARRADSQWLNYVKGSIHGVKFHDLNGDGLFNDRVPGTATLVVTGGSGNQLMLADISQINQNFPYDVIVTQNANSANPQTRTVKVVDIDIPNQKLILAATTPLTLTIDGIDDTVKVPTGNPDVIPGVTIQLWKYQSVTTNNFTTFGAPGPVFKWTPVNQITDAHGEFWFSHLDPGRYAVREVPPAGFPGQSTLQALGSPNGVVNGTTIVDHGDDPNDPATGTITVLSRQEYQWEDNQFGRPVTVPGYGSIPGLTPAQLTTALTPFVPNFRPYDGPAYLRPMDGVGGTTNGILDLDEHVAAYVRNALKTPIVYNGLEDLGVGTPQQSLLFGNFKAVDIEGDKYNDLNGDQIKDGDPGFANVTFVLYNAAGTAPILTPTITGPGTQMMPVTVKTDANGHFKFTNVKPGTYTVREANAQNPGVPFQDTNNDGINDVAFQGLVLANNNASPVAVTSGTNFNFSTPVDLDNNPATPNVPTHQWFNYVSGSIHGVKFEDIDGDGVFDDTRIVLAETTLEDNLSDDYSDTSVVVDDSSIFPTSGYPYQIYILDGSGNIAETLTVTNNNTATNTLTVLDRGVPVEHNPGAVVQGPTTVLPNVVPAALQGVAFELWRFASQRHITVANSNAQYDVFDWTKVNSATQFSDIHGEYWFTGLKPGQYTVRENLQTKMTRLMVGGLPQSPSALANNATFQIDGITYTVAVNGVTSLSTAGTTLGIPSGATNTQAAAIIAAAVNANSGASSIDAFNAKASSSFNKITLFNPSNGNQVNTTTTTGLTRERFNFSEYQQSTTQAQGSPNSNVPQNTSTYVFDQSTIFGQNPSLPTSSTITVAGSQEYVWAAGHNVMAVDGRIDPRLGTPGYAPQYPAPFNTLTASDYNSSIHGEVDGNLDIFEQAWAAAKEVLKTPILIGVDGRALQYGNYDPASIEGDKYIVTQFIGDTVAAREPLPGIVMVLTGVDGAGNPIIPRTTVTNGNGHFKFSGLRPGTYTVVEQATQDLNNDGVDDIVKQGLHIDSAPQTVTVKSGQEFNFSDKVDADQVPSTPAIPTHEWLNWIEVSFHGLKFHDINADGRMNDLVDHDNDDANNDGIKDVGGGSATPLRQAVLPGVTFDIYMYTGIHKVNPLSTGSQTINDWIKLPSATTDVHGEFWFTGLKPGIYTIRENLDPTPGVGNDPYEGYYQSTLQAQGSPIASANNPLGDDPTKSATGAIANLNVRWTNSGIGAVPAWLDTDPGLGVTPSSQTSINGVDGVGYDDSVRTFSATGNVPGYNPPTYQFSNGEGSDNGFIGGEYQWSNGTGVVPYAAAAFQRPMDTNNNQNIDESEKRDAIVGTALKQAGTLDRSYGSRSLLWGNYLPTKIIGEKFEDIDGDGKYDNGTASGNGVFGNTNLSEPGFKNVKFEILRDLDGVPGGATLPVTTLMLAGGSNSINPTGLVRATATISNGANAITFTASPGPEGNDILLQFGAGQSVSDVVNAWNAANGGGLTFAPGGNGGFVPFSQNITSVQLSGAGQFVTTLTDPNGMFMFAGLVPGNYMVRETAAQDTGKNALGNPDGVDDVLYQGLVIDTAAPNTTLKSGATFNFSTKLNALGQPDPLGQPTHIWLNYVQGSIHGLKFNDLNGNGIFDDQVRDTTTNSLSQALAGTFNATLVHVANASLFPAPASSAGYTIQILKNNGQVSETLTVLSRNTANNTLTVAPRGVPVAHSNGSAISLPTADPAVMKNAYLQNVAFQLYKFVGTRNLHAPSSTIYPVYDWQLVDSATQFTDIHGEFWFTGLQPGKYTVRENLDLQRSVITVGAAPTGTFNVNGQTYEFDTDANVAQGNIQVYILGLNSDQIAAAIVSAINSNNDDAVDGFAKATRVGSTVSVIHAGLLSYSQSSVSSTPDYSNYGQSTTQAEGSPAHGISDFSGFTNSQFATTFLGDNPALPGSSTYTVSSRQEYMRVAGDNIMPVDGQVNPLVKNGDAHPTIANLVFNSSIHGKVDQNIDPFEQLWAVQKEALKTPIVVGAALAWGNFDGASIEGDKYIVNQFIGDTVASRQALPGIVMVLTGTDGAGNTIVPRTTVTNGNGRFKFSGLQPGTYTVTERATQDLNKDGVDDVAVQGLHIDSAPQTVTVTNGQKFDFSAKVDLDLNPATPAVPTHEWLNWIEVSFHGIKFHDLNADGVANDLVDHDGDDPDGDGKKADGVTSATLERQAILPGVVFDIYYYTGMHRVNPLSTGAQNINDWVRLTPATTDVHGEFWFTGLKPGIYTIRENLAASGNDPNGVPYSSYFQSTKQKQSSPIATVGANSANPYGDDPSDSATGAIANLNVQLTGDGSGQVQGWLDNDPESGIMAVPTFYNWVQSDGYAATSTQQRSYPAIPGLNIPAYPPANTPQYTGFIGGEYQWSNGTGVVPYAAAAFQRPMDTSGNQNIDEIEKRAAVVGTALKQAGVPGGESWVGEMRNDFEPARSLSWGNYLPVKIIGEKFEDLDGDGTYDQGTTSGDGVFGNTSQSDLPLPGIKFEILRNGLTITTAMLAGGTNSNPTAERQINAIGSTGGATFTSANAGLIGNQIKLVFNGTDRIDTVVANWNAANPLNKVDALNIVYVTGVNGLTVLTPRVLTLQGPVQVFATSGLNGMFMFGNLVPGDYTVRETAKQDSNGDGIDDIQFQELVLGNNNAPIVSLLSPQGTETGVFNFSTPVDDNDPLTTDVPTHIWLNYVKGSIHGRKFHDLNADGTPDQVVRTTTAILATGGLSANYLDVTINVTSASAFPATPGYKITILDTNGNVAETLTVVSVNKTLNKITVAQRGVPVAHLAGAKIVLPTANPPQMKDAILEGVAFQIYKYLGTRDLHSPSSSHFDVYDWQLVESQTQFTDLHGQFWFTGLQPGQYTVRENLDLQRSVITLTTLPTDAQSFDLNGKTYEFDNDNSLVNANNIPIAIPTNGNLLNKLADRIAAAINSGNDDAVNGLAKASASGSVVTIVYAGELADIQNYGTVTSTKDYSGMVQSTSQEQGSPAHGITSFTGFTTEDYLTTFLGDNPATLVGSFYSVQSRQEYVRIAGEHFMPVDGKVNPNMLPGTLHPTNVPPLAYNPAVHGKVDLIIDPFEQLWAQQKQALKSPQVVGAALDWGNFTPVMISGEKFHDLNGDGKQTRNANGNLTKFDQRGDGTTNETEGGFANIVFVLLDANNVPAKTDGGATITATTDSDGKFKFSGVKPGRDYWVAERATQDFNNDQVDDISQGLVLDGTRIMVSLLSGDMINISALADNDNDPSTAPAPRYQWFNYISGSVHGFKFRDYNRDGTWQESGPNAEPPLEGVTFDLWRFVETQHITVSNIDRTIYHWVKTQSVVSDVHGEYWFTGLRPGKYTVRENLGTPPVFKQTTSQAQDDPNAFVSEDGLVMGEAPITEPGTTSIITVLSQQEYVWRVGKHLMPIDANGNQVIDPSEWQLAYQKAALKYSAGFTPGVDYADPSKKFTPTNPTKNGGLLLGELGGSPSSLIYGNNYVPGAFHGFKFEDVNGNGRYDGPTSVYVENGEPGISNILVGLVDANDNIVKQADNTLAIALTAKDSLSTPNVNETGHFWITNLIPGNYKLVEFLNGVLVDHDNNSSTPKIYIPAKANGSPLFPTPAGESAAARATRLLAESAMISDSNGDKIPDGLQMMYQSTVHTTMTIGALQAHTYTAGGSLMNGQPVLVPGESLSDPDRLQFTEVFTPSVPNVGGPARPVNANMTIGNYVSGSIHGFKFLDKDANGIYNPVDGTHPNWDMPFEWALFGLFTDALGTLPAVDASGNPIQVAMSDLNGQFWIENIKPGNYFLIELIGRINRNDTDGDGFPNGNFQPNGDPIFDVTEGLMASTPTVRPITIRSREEHAYTSGASHITDSFTFSADPDNAAGVNATSIKNSFQHVTLTSVNASSTGVVTNPDIVKLNPVTWYAPSTGTFGYGYVDGGVNKDQFIFQNIVGGPSSVFHAVFSVDVKSVSIDVIANDSNDVGLLKAYDKLGNQLGVVTTAALSGFSPNPALRVQTLTFTSTNGTPIYRIEAGGNGDVNVPGDLPGRVGSTVLLDNLQFQTFTLKKEVVVGDALKFGNFYAGGVGGIKTHQGSNNPAPGITLFLSNAQHTYTTTTSATGSYFFKDVIPGVYALSEANHSSVLVGFGSVPVTVPHATVVVHQSGAATVYPGLQTETLQPSLAVKNLVKGSIHGRRTGADGVTGQPGITVELHGLVNGVSTVLQTSVTDAQGKFNFENLDPRNSYGSGSFTIITQETPAMVYSVLVGSGVEVDYNVNAPLPSLQPGQIEIDDPGLILKRDLPGAIRGVVIGGNGTLAVGLNVSLYSGAGVLITSQATGVDGEFDFDGLTPGNYQVRVAGQTVMIALASGEEEVFATGESILETGQFETINPALIINLSGAPRVSSVKVANENWNTGFKNAIDPVAGKGYQIPTGSNVQFNPVSWSNINQLLVEFTTDVIGSGTVVTRLTAADFALASTTGITITGVTYDSVNLRATLSLSGNLGRARYTLTVKDTIKDFATGTKALDGEFSNGISTYNLGGNGIPGTDFGFQFSVSPANANFEAINDALGAVNIFDLGFLAGKLNVNAGNPNYSAASDFNGDGGVNIFDLGFMAGQLNQQLPALPFSASLDSLDGLFGDDDEEFGNPEFDDAIDLLFQ